MANSRTLLMFGPGAMTLSEPYFNSIISFISTDTASQWAINAVDDIESHWPSLCKAIPKLQSISGVSYAQKLGQWLRAGALPPGSTVANLPNAILGPLVVIAQLVEYLLHIDSTSQGGLRGGQGFHVPSAAHTETVGCCLGTFSALVVSSSATWAQFCHSAGAVVRIVFVLAALSDAEDASSGSSVSLIAFWRNGQSLSGLARALEKFPEAYTSVIYDENRVTVTTSTQTVPALKLHLQTVGITANETEFHGRFHSNQLYKRELDALLRYCKRYLTFQLPDASCIVLPTRVNSEKTVAEHESLLDISSAAFLVSQFNWIKTFRAAISNTLQDRSSRIIEFGPERCVPPTLLRRVNSQVVHFDFEGSISASKPSLDAKLPTGVAENDIAVVGMACKVAGAEDIDEYWQILLRGESQHTELVPNARFAMETPFRPAEKGDEIKKWYGNFIGDQDAFDYKFFKKSPREVLHMDPQQRLMLQAAYQALANSGYYSGPTPDKKIGCYIGVVSNDYENNISHTTPTAFSATGALRSYIAGKVSHYFGWTGPAMTVDTACSASTVAIDLACKAILSGECSAALAGGTNMYTTPMFFQNLAAGTFLSTTGQCKPFDTKADGYCRGEAIGAVVLKKLSQAITDGDHVLGVICATAINQNQNITPIFVPNSASLTSVFRTALQKSGIDARDISVVEAHGTGTPVGDPVEYDSIRQVFGGTIRSGLDPLQVGSVKGLIGHTEGASGVVALIKILLMMQKGCIPPQASFQSINPAIKQSLSDNLSITKSSIPWTRDFKAALINNYGAAGSNASMVIKQCPVISSQKAAIAGQVEENFESKPRLPFYISGLDAKVVTSYAERLRQFIRARASTNDALDIEDLAFNLNRQSNWSLSQGFICSAESVADLEAKLVSVDTFSAQSSKPVILCFGGQVSNFVGLSRHVFDKSAMLRQYLDRCDLACKSIGAGSIYPNIFQRDPIDDPSILQPLLFSIQYSCAMTWIDCGIQPSALVGHSFGELTALCVSGALSVEDTVKLVYGRSKVIKEAWGPEKGSMLAIEGDLEGVNSLIETANMQLGDEKGAHKTTIACFNGPRSFTLGGSSGGIDAVQQAISDRAADQPVIKYKRLSVTNAFHSLLVEPLKPRLEAVGRELTFSTPKLPLELATQGHEDKLLTASYVADHMREPVYFGHAVERLHEKYGQAVWLEAGSNSTITTMASRALGSPKGSTFQPVNVTSSHQALSQLSDVTMNLWKAGQPVTFWPHSRVQTYEYKNVILPPYQFEKHRQWLDFKPPEKLTLSNPTKPADRDIGEAPAPFSIFTLSDKTATGYRFAVNMTSKQFLDLTSDYSVATTPSLPVSFEVDLAIQAITSIHPELATANIEPHIYNVVNLQYISALSGRIYIEFENLGQDRYSWAFKIASSGEGLGESLHISGQLFFRTREDARSRLEFARFDRFVTHHRCLQALETSHRDDDVIQGQSIYNVFSDIAKYGRGLRGMQKLVGRSNESAARIVRRRSGKLLIDPSLREVFSQTGAIWANCMAGDRREAKGTVYLPTAIEQWSMSPSVSKKFTDGFYERDPEIEWHVLAQHKRGPQDSFTTDIFVFEATSGDLEEVILGIQYSPVVRNELSTSLPITAVPMVAANVVNPSNIYSALPPVAEQKLRMGEPGAAAKSTQAITAKVDVKADIWRKLQPVLADISGLEPDEIKQTDSLADIGIDSLMGMEMAREVETVFNCTIEQSELVSIVDVPGILSFLLSTLNYEAGNDTSDSASIASSSTQNNSSRNGGSVPTPGSEALTPDLKAFGGSSVEFPASAILEAFGESSALTDQFLKSWGCAGYLDGLSQKQTRLCLALTNAAFKELGCDLAAAKAGDALEHVPVVSRQKRFRNSIYEMLEETRIIDMDGDVITRTAIPIPPQSPDAILQDLMRRHADNGSSHQLTYNVGSRMADVLSGKADGPQLIFGDAKNRELVANFYGELPFNKLYFEQMADFLGRLAGKLKLSSFSSTTLKILEMGAGTGGTTKVLLPALAKLGIPVEYTFTDLSPSLVAQAKRRFKDYPFMKFAVHDIEQPPSAPELIGSQHVVIASNAVHATHSLQVSARNILKFLRPDGFLMILEMMRTLHWVDVVWGTLEGWGLFDDGRTHAIVNERHWEKELLASGFKCVRWTDGKLPENHVQRVLIALASEADEDIDDLPTLVSHADLDDSHGESKPDLDALKQAGNTYVQNAITGFTIPSYNGPVINSSGSGSSILVTGATGSLGSHVVTHLVGSPSVDRVFCLNREPTGSKGEGGQCQDPLRRQTQVLASKGIKLGAQELDKLKVIETDFTQPRLGLDDEQYDHLVNNITHIIHSAFPVNGLRSLKQNEPQFFLMRNLVDLAASVSARRGDDFKVTFQFISSLSAVGMYPIVHGHARVPEEQWDVDSALRNGYGGAKVICERILLDTLGQLPDRFRAMTVRLGQLSGSVKTGYWNRMEVLSFLFKSSQTLRALPEVEGIISWLPLEEASASLAELLLRNNPSCHAIYHLDNPVPRDWKGVILALAKQLDIPQSRIIPFQEWLRRVRAYPGEDPWDNPAAKALEFFEHKFKHMSCGGVTMATDNAREHSSILRAVQPVSDELISKYIQAWKESGFLR